MEKEKNTQPIRIKPILVSLILLAIGIIAFGGQNAFAYLQSQTKGGTACADCTIAPPPTMVTGPSKGSIKNNQDLQIAQNRDPAAPPPPGEAANADMKLGGKANCWCDVECTSSDGKVSITPSTSFGGYTQAWPGEKQRCEAACNAHVRQNINSWAEQNKACRGLTCKMKSHVGTQSESDLGSVSADTGDKPWCKASGNGGPAAPCCPPFTGAKMGTLFKAEQNPNISGEYIMRYIQDPAFDQLMQAYSTLAGLAAGASPVTITYKLTDISAGGVLLDTISVVYGSGNPSATMFNAILYPNHQYMITSYVTFPRGTTYKSPNCTDRWAKYTIGFEAGKVAAGANAARITSSN